MKKQLLFLFSLLPFFTFAGGFQINSQGQKASGMAGAFSGVASDASAVYFNPAGIVFHEHNMFDAGFNAMLVNTSFLSASDGDVDAKTALLVPFHLYATHRFENKRLFGSIGIYSPFNTSIKWNDKWPGRYLTQQTKLTTLFLQPTLSYRFDRNYSVGLGLIGATGFIKMRKAYQANDDIELDLKGTGYGYGINLAVFAHYDYVNISIDYRSAVKLITNNGKAEFSNIPSSFLEMNSYPSSAKFSSSVNLPSTINFGIGWFPTDRISTDLDIDYTTWKHFNDWNVRIKDYDALNTHLTRYYDNTVAIRIGGQYHWSDKMDYRLGDAYEGAASTGSYIYPDLPDALNFEVAAGATRHIKPKLSVDASFILGDYAQQKESGNKKGFNGSYKKTIYSLGLGLHYEF